MSSKVMDGGTMGFKKLLSCSVAKKKRAPFELLLCFRKIQEKLYELSHPVIYITKKTQVTF